MAACNALVKMLGECDHTVERFAEARLIYTPFVPCHPQGQAQRGSRRSRFMGARRRFCAFARGNLEPCKGFGGFAFVALSGAFEIRTTNGKHSVFFEIWCCNTNPRQVNRPCIHWAAPLWLMHAESESTGTSGFLSAASTLSSADAEPTSLMVRPFLRRDPPGLNDAYVFEAGCARGRARRFHGVSDIVDRRQGTFHCRQTPQLSFTLRMGRRAARERAAPEAPGSAPKTFSDIYPRYRHNPTDDDYRG